MEMMEQMAVELQLLNDDDRINIIQLFQSISSEYSGERGNFVKELPESLGLI